MVPAIDSYLAFGANSGTTRASAQFIAWPGVVLYEVPSGQADASGNFGATTGTAQDNQNTPFPVYGISPEGHSANGLLKDRLIAHGGFTAGNVTKYEGSAIPGKLAGEFVGAQPTGVPTHFMWQAIDNALTTAPPGTRVVVPITQGGNDMIANFAGLLNPETPGFWDGVVATTAASCESNIDYIISKKPPGVLLEIVWCSYPNLLIEDGIPVGYPPNANAEAPFRCVWVTNSFGFYNQAVFDQNNEINNFSAAAAYNGPQYPYFDWYDIFPPYAFHHDFVPDIYNLNRNYWIAALNSALVSDLLCRLAQGACVGAVSIDPAIWANTVQNITQQTVNEKFHRLFNANAVTAAKYQPGGPKHNAEVNVIHVDMRSAMNPDPAQVTSGVPAQYQSAPKSRFVEGVHLNRTGFIEYWDKVIDRWFPLSMFPDISCAPTAYPDTINTAVNTPGAVDVLLNDSPGDTSIDPTSVQLLNPLFASWSGVVNTPFEGTWVVPVGSSTVTFVPYTDFFGVSVVTYRFRTLDGRYASSTITANVAQPPPRCPPQVADLFVA